MTRRTGQHHGDLRRALLDAALELVGETDGSSLTLREVARRAGVSPAAPYHHFQDKATLLAAVAREGFEALIAEQRAVTAPTPAARLAGMASRYVRFALEHPTHYALMFQRFPDGIEGEEGDALEAVARQSFDELVTAIREVQGSLGPAEASEIALHAWSHAHGAVQICAWASGLDPSFHPDQFAEGVGRAVVAMVQALAASGGTAPRLT